MRKTRFLSKLILVLVLFSVTTDLPAQVTFPENGIADPRHGHYAFTNATIVKDAATTLTNATLVIKDGKIVAAGNNLKVPAGAVEIDCKGKYIYPSFIDIYADYGTPALQRVGSGFTPGQQPQLATATKGPYGWNQAIKSDAEASKVFAVDDAKAKPLAKSITAKEIIPALVFGLAPLLLFQRVEILYALIFPLLGTFFLRRYFHKWIGGYTGDCLGATQQVTEVLFYMNLLIFWKIEYILL